AYKIVSAKGDVQQIEKLRKMLIQGREHLRSMANPSARFGWYEEMPDDDFITTYAYLADMFASQALNDPFPRESFGKIVGNYRTAANGNVLKEAFMLWMGAQMGQPVQGILVPMLKD